MEYQHHHNFFKFSSWLIPIIEVTKNEEIKKKKKNFEYLF